MYVPKVGDMVEITGYEGITEIGRVSYVAHWGTPEAHLEIITEDGFTAYPWFSNSTFVRKLTPLEELL